MSQVSAGVNPNKLPATSSDAKAAGLYTQVVTIDQDNSPAIPAESAEKVNIDFPAEMNYTANNKLAKCTLATIGTATGDGALAACGDALVGSGHAFARIPGFPTTNSEAELTVSVFNSDTSTAAGGFTGGFPTIILHADDNGALPSVPVVGEIRNSSAGSDYGRELNVPDAPDVAGDTGALVQFGAQVARKYTNGKTGQKKKTYNLVTANCGGADGDLDFRAVWEYDDTTTDTDTYAQNCAN